jgi:hypothetical protein
MKCVGGVELTSNDDDFVLDASTRHQQTRIRLRLRTTFPYLLTSQISRDTPDSLQTLECLWLG